MRLLTVLAFFVFAICASASVAAPAGDPFTVSGIAVDASAASATEAQTIAINSGRQRPGRPCFTV